MSRAAMRQALEALESATSFMSKKVRDHHGKTVADLRAALAQQEDPRAFVRHIDAELAEAGQEPYTNVHQGRTHLLTAARAFLAASAGNLPAHLAQPAQALRNAAEGAFRPRPAIVAGWQFKELEFSGTIIATRPDGTTFTVPDGRMDSMAGRALLGAMAAALGGAL